MIVGWKIEWEGWIMWSAICFPKEFIYFGERSSIFPSNSKRGPGPGGEAFLERKKSHILWMDIFSPSASSLPSLGEGGRAGHPPRSSWWAGYKGNVSQTSKCRNLPWSSSPNAGEKSTPVRPVGSTKGDVELAWGALAAREAGGLPIHPPPIQRAWLEFLWTWDPQELGPEEELHPSSTYRAECQTHPHRDPGPEVSGKEKYAL